MDEEYNRPAAELLNLAYSMLRVGAADWAPREALRSLLLIRSASNPVLMRSLEWLDSCRPSKLHILTHARDAEETRRLCGPEAILHLQSEGALLSRCTLAGVIESLRSTRLDGILILLNNHLGIGYENIFEIALAIGHPTLLTFNGAGDVRLIRNPCSYRSSLVLIRALADWHWEQLGADRRIG